MVVHSDRPARIPEHAEEHGEHEYQAVFGLVDPVVALGYPDDGSVVEWPCNECPDDGPDEAGEVREALFGSIISIRGKGEVREEQRTI